MKKRIIYIAIILVIIISSCQPPQPRKKTINVKHNYIILLDLSDRLIVQPDQPARDKEIIQAIYSMFEKRVQKQLYIKSRDEIKVVIAPQKGSGIRADQYEDKLYVNMDKIKNVYRRPQEEQRRDTFNEALYELYKKATFSKEPKDYYGADIWKYFYEDLKLDYSEDTLTKNFLFIMTDGYPIVGKDLTKLQPVNKSFPDLHIILLEGSPRDKDLEWDRVMDLWTKWFDSMDIADYTFIKRRGVSKVVEQIEELINKGEN
ncbi:MAG: hypothetical protein JW894_12860 [Bacteroidales bacterium]|nr:hypothetical protein [Bacteroidales bacterium]